MGNYDHDEVRKTALRFDVAQTQLRDDFASRIEIAHQAQRAITQFRYQYPGEVEILKQALQAIEYMGRQNISNHAVLLQAQKAINSMQFTYIDQKQIIEQFRQSLNSHINNFDSVQNIRNIFQQLDIKSLQELFVFAPETIESLNEVANRLSASEIGTEENDNIRNPEDDAKNLAEFLVEYDGKELKEMIGESSFIEPTLEVLNKNLPLSQLPEVVKQQYDLLESLSLNSPYVIYSIIFAVATAWYSKERSFESLMVFEGQILALVVWLLRKYKKSE